jgi:DNA-binding NtrC family response regulator
MRRGAKDFIQKPWDNARLLAIVKTQLELSAALRRGARLEAENRLLQAEGRPVMIAESRAMKPVLELVARVGPSDANVLITGEPGTGKEVVARTLHAISERAQQPMVTVNMGGLAEGVFESELFGHVKGAFTDAKMDRVGRFELADGGTLFLDEIANLPFNLQAKLLRVLETGEMERVGSSKTKQVNVRVISATNADPHREVAESRFRQDLLFRLNTIEIRLPALRERGEDILPLARHFITFYGGLEAPRLSLDADAVLRSYAWPGNVRELENVMKRVAALHADEDVVDAGALLPFLDRGNTAQPAEDERHGRERAEILAAFDQAHGNRSRVAEILGVSRKTLYARLKRLHLQLP